MIFRYLTEFLMYRTFISKLIINRMLNAFAIHKFIFDENGELYDYKFTNVNKAFKYHTGIKENPIGKTYRQLVKEPSIDLINKYANLTKNDSSIRFEIYEANLEKFFVINAFKTSNKTFVTIFNDVTEIKRNEEKLIKAKNKAEEADRLKSAFLANMSHEIRTPMNAIIGFSDLLKNQNIPDEERDNYLDIIINSGNKLIFLIDNLINIAKIESNQYKITKNLFNIIELFNELEDRFKRSPKLKSNNIDFNFEIKDIVISIYSDKTLLNHILSNIIINAIKYTTNGFIKIYYSLIDNNTLEVCVKDTGCGISDDNMKIIFERFRRVDDTKGYTPNGSGLGLALSKGFIELLGGKLSVESKPNFGSIFKITIPINIDGSTNIDPPTMVVDENNFPKLKNVLIIEDDKNSSDYLNILINEKYKGVNIINAYDGKEGLKLYKKNKGNLALILLDLRLPEISGYEILKKIREEDSEVIIIVQSANVMNNLIDNCMGNGCNGYLAKPIVTENLYTKLDKYL